MPSLRHMLNALALLVLFAGSPVSAEAPQPDGRWVARTGGRAIMLVELAKGRQWGTWVGRLIKPSKSPYSSTGSFYEVSGMATARPLTASADQNRRLVLTAPAKNTGELSDHFTFMVLDNGHATFQFDPRVAPIPLMRAREGEIIEGKWDSSRDYPVDQNWPSNPELSALFEADQAVRRDRSHPRRALMGKDDEVRRMRTKVLLQTGQIRSGDDFFYAAFIFQHGDQAKDYLLAHTFAVIAAARGRPDAAWIAAATLDRYLHSIGQKQVYGTQYSLPKGQPPTQEPYDRVLVSDPLRMALGVPPVAAQEQQRAQMAKEMSQIQH